MHNLHIYHLFTEYKHDRILLTTTIYEHCMVLNSNDPTKSNQSALILFSQGHSIHCVVMSATISARETMFGSS